MPDTSIGSAQPAATFNENLISAALNGFIEGAGNWRPGTLAGFTEVGAYLTGQGTEVPVRWRGWNWHQFIGGIGAVALHATAFHVPDDLRAVQLATLDVWSATPFADPGARARMRTGTIVLADKDTYAARDAHGAVFSPHGLGAGQEAQRFIELRTGEAEPPSPGRILTAEPVRGELGDPAAAAAARPPRTGEGPRALGPYGGRAPGRGDGPEPGRRGAAARRAARCGVRIPKPERRGTQDDGPEAGGSGRRRTGVGIPSRARPPRPAGRRTA
ncbi:hypothetical protein ACIBI4_18265 [Streptomyces sp. NPDC050418]|uniref:hypothetical protein n=1 Tax=Streptomyces sp. NPDC050418 TaxID=3365612 RepID=UPI0037986AAC